jgi:general secretion pathway protein J
MTASRLRRSRAFTLIEVMIAAAILAAMGGLVFGMFARAWKEKEDVQAVDDRYAQIRAAMDRMSQEISEAYLSDHYDKSRFQVRPTIFRGRSDELIFTAFANERFEPDSKTSDQAVVSFFIDRDQNAPGGESLYRRVNPIVDEDAERHGAKLVLCQDVKRIRFEYWNTTRLGWDEEWDASRSEHLGVLPERVRITAYYADENGKERKFTTQTDIQLLKSLAF